MKRLSFLAAILTALPAASLGQQTPAAQNKKFDAAITSWNLKGGGSDLALFLVVETNYPKDTVLSFWPKMQKHYYLWKEKEFTIGNFDTVPPARMNSTVTGKTLKVDPLKIPSPGNYELCMVFNPAVQSKPDVVKKAVGRLNWFAREFPAKLVTLGDSKSMTQTLMDDTEDCRRLIKRSLELIDEIEKDSQGKDWKERSPKMLDEVVKLKSKAAERAEKTLHHAAYKMIDEILQEVAVVVQQAKMMASMGAPTTGGGGGKPSTGNPTGTGAGEDPEQNHNQNGGGDPAIAGLDGKKLTFEKAKDHVKTCDVIRIREFLSWETLLLQDAIKRVNDAYAASKDGSKSLEDFRKARDQAQKVVDDIERAYKHLEASDGSKEAFVEFTKYAIEGVKEPVLLKVLLKKVSDYTLALLEDAMKGSGPVPESVKSLQDELKAKIDTARAKIMGMKKKKAE